MNRTKQNSRTFERKHERMLTQISTVRLVTSRVLMWWWMQESERNPDTPFRSCGAGNYTYLVSPALENAVPSHSHNELGRMPIPLHMLLPMPKGYSSCYYSLLLLLLLVLSPAKGILHKFTCCKISLSLFLCKIKYHSSAVDSHRWW